MITYFKNLFSGIWALLQGMYITMLNFWRPKVTELYPETRGTDKDKSMQFERFRANLVLDIDEEKNEHKCIACGLCERNCPNESLKIESHFETTEDGKKKKVLDKYVWDLGSCTFCSLCVSSCASKAIHFTNQFEHASFERNSLVKQLKPEGAKLAEKKTAVVPPTVNKKPEGGTTEQNVQQ